MYKFRQATVFAAILVLSSCTNDNSITDAAGKQKNISSLVKGMGLDPEALNKGEGPWTIVNNVTPKYDALVRLKFDSEMRLDGTAYFFDTSGRDYNAIRSKLENAMTRVVANKDPINTGIGKFRKKVPLRQLRFKNITNVVVLFDHAGINFPQCGAGTSTDTGCRQIFFTENLLSGTPALPNDSFYNLRKDALTYKTITGEQITREVLFFQNLHRGKNSSGNYETIPETANVQNNYSLNI